MELFGSGVLFKQLIELLEVFGWVPDAMTVQDASPKATDGVVYGNLVIDRGQLWLESQELAVVLPQGFFLLLFVEWHLGQGIGVWAVPLKVKQKLVPETFPGVDGQWGQSGIPGQGRTLEGDNERLGHRGVVPSGWCDGDLIAHDVLCWVSAAVVLGVGPCPEVGRPWWHLQLRHQGASLIEVVDALKRCGVRDEGSALGNE
jgi:hypothetical protein